MPVQFEHPWILLVIIPLAVLIGWAWRRDVRVKQPKKGIVFTLRSLVLICLVFAVAGMQIVWSVDRLAVLYVVDRSDSVQADQSLLNWISLADQHKQTDDVSGIVSFGHESAIERMPNEQPIEAERLHSLLNTDYTNIESGLRTAYGLMPESAAGRIVLLSDGIETNGSTLSQGKLLMYAGVPVDVLPVETSPGSDAAVEQVTVPEQLRSEDQYPIGVQISSTYQTSANLRIYEDNREILSTTVELQSGNNEFVFQSVAGEAGLHRYRVEIYPEGDERSVNDQAYAFSRVVGAPKVLVVSETEAEHANIAAILEAASIRYDAIVPGLLPNELSGYTSYDSILLNNVAATSISQTKMEWIEQAVRDFGVGLVMTGGDNSFGLGGYFQTPIERALPVYMDLRGQRQIPSLGLILVIDRSGSMQGDKIELAKEAAIRTMELMREQDTLGVIAFDSNPWWAVEAQKLTDKKEIEKNILSIQAGGGTEIFPAVEQAVQSLIHTEAQRKHIILLTDGHSATSPNYVQLAEQMEAEGITLSTVGIGQGAEQQFLERLAELGKGRHYFTEDQSTIPTIFSREAVLMTRTYIVDEPFYPQLYQGLDWHRLFSEGAPQVNAYVATTPKETAESVLISPEPDPLLARWQYGAGKAVAWTSDMNGRWAGSWIAWPSFSGIFSEILQWTFPQFQTSPLSFSSRLEGDEAVLRVQTPEDMLNVQLEAFISGNDGDSQKVTFSPVLPGEYETKIQMDEPGVYMTRIDMRGINDDGEDTLLGSWSTGFVIPYSPEYSLSANDSVLIAELAEMTGGRVLSLDQPNELYNVDRPSVTDSKDVVRPLLIAALLLWVLDIAARRLSIPWARWLGSVKSFTSARRNENESQTSSSNESLNRLQQRKRKIDERIPAMDEMRQRTDAGSEEIKRQSSFTQRAKNDERQTGSTNEANKLVNDSGKKTESSDREDRINRLLQAKNRKKR